MNNNFLNKQNVNNVYEYVNTHLVKNYNTNLNEDKKIKRFLKNMKSVYNNLKIIEIQQYK